jgi:type II secretory ATPase GspE/PulE/Tfp pilus assembly ATPase PilB-like protein
MPHGIILVTGPTGSGKTTTLYTALNTLNTPERKIITVEDPVEYRATDAQAALRPLRPRYEGLPLSATPRGCG